MRPLPSRLSTLLPVLLVLGVLSSACGGSECATEGAESQYRTELFFGLSRKGNPDVTDAEWRDFVDISVTPRFQEGLTVYDTYGQYLSDSGELVHENSKVILLLHDGASARSKDIDALCEEYKQRFQQESVLRVDSLTCVSFK